MIWTEVADELRAKEHEEILRKRIFLRRLPIKLDQEINRCLDPIECLLSTPDLDPDHCTSAASSCAKTVTQFKFDLMAHYINAIQLKNRTHRTKLHYLQEKLSQFTTEMHFSLKQIVNSREQAMRDRHQTYLQHKLNTFFDQAPMAATNE